jgi:ADP-ribose pyrophosphatase YjhB (NUDIX family)
MMRRKVYAYVTHDCRLLVFRHMDLPKAGVQVPGGTVEDGETFEEALIREVREESGLEGLELCGLLGEQASDRSDFGVAEVQQQRFYHLRCQQAPAERWRHLERDASDGSGPLRFEFWWAALDDLPELAGTQGQFLPEL